MDLQLRALFGLLVPSVVENDVIQTVVIDVAKSDPMPVDPTAAFVNDPRLEDRFALLVLSQLVGHGRMRLIP